MRYFMIGPRGTWRGDWKIEQRAEVWRLDENVSFYAVDGPEPPLGATGVIKTDASGIIVWWPVHDAPPREAFDYLTKTVDPAPQEGKGDSAT